MALSSRRIAVALLIAATARTSYAHEHHDDAIPEGEAISPDPLVSWKRTTTHNGGVDAYGIIGFYIMDTYSSTDVCFWHHLPHWNGIRSKSMTTLVSQQWRLGQKGSGMADSLCR
jgi:hypothetical protein